MYSRAAGTPLSRKARPGSLTNEKGGTIHQRNLLSDEATDCVFVQLATSCADLNVLYNPLGLQPAVSVVQ